MSNYIANSKNRKLKKQILLFLERLNFGAGKLPFSGRVILFMNFLLGISLFLPWFHFSFMNKQADSIFAFSGYTGYLGYGMIIAIIAIPFFLVSHAKKERIRAHIPFRLSDTQAVVFITAILLTAYIHLLLMSRTFDQFTLGVEIGSGFIIAMSSSILIIFSAFFLSKSTKEQGMDIRYFQHHDQSQFDEYRDILHGSGKKDDDSNMTLPI